MSDRWQVKDLQPGMEMEATFYPNPQAESGFRFRATHLQGRRAPKVVLCDDPRVRPGSPCMVRILRVFKPQRDDRGHIEVEFVQQQDFPIEGVYIDPMVALKLALDATRRVYNPIENNFLPIPDNVQFIAAVNRGGEFSGTFGIDPAQLDRFAPLQMDYPPMEEEMKLLQPRHPELNDKTVALVVEIADALRRSAELSIGLSVRATDEACTYLKYPPIASQPKAMLAEVRKSSFCGRYSGRWSQVNTDAGVAWSIIQRMLRE